MREELQQINHLAEVLYNESRNLDTVSKGKAQLYQSIIDEMQEHIDNIINELLKAERENTMNEDLKTIAQLAQELGVTRQAVYQKTSIILNCQKNISKFTVKQKNKTLYDLQAQELIKQAFESNASVNSKVNIDSKLIDSLQAQIDYLKAEHEKDRIERQAILAKYMAINEERQKLQIELQSYKAIEEKKEAEQAQIKELKEKAEKAQTEKEQAEQVAAELAERIKELETAANQELQKKKSWLSRLLRRA